MKTLRPKCAAITAEATSHQYLVRTAPFSVDLGPPTRAPQYRSLPSMTTTPPRSSSLAPQGTPVHTRSSTTGKFDSKYEDRQGILPRLANEMGPFFVGPICPHTFLDLFLPPPSTRSSVAPFEEGMFGSLIEALSAKPKNEKAAYDILVSSVTPVAHRTRSSVLRF